jgi:hypothetical protein
MSIPFQHHTTENEKQQTKIQTSKKIKSHLTSIFYTCSQQINLLTYFFSISKFQRIIIKACREHHLSFLKQILKQVIPVNDSETVVVCAFINSTCFSFFKKVVDLVLKTDSTFLSTIFKNPAIIKTISSFEIRYEFVRYLLQKGAAFSLKLLQTSAYVGDLKLVDYYLKLDRNYRDTFKTFIPKARLSASFRSFTFHTKMNHLLLTKPSMEVERSVIKNFEYFDRVRESNSEMNLLKNSQTVVECKKKITKKIISKRGLKIF